MWTHLETFVQLFYSIGQLVQLWETDSHVFRLAMPNASSQKTLGKRIIWKQNSNKAINISLEVLTTYLR